MSAAHHDDGHEAFDPEPIAEIGADETPSPGWLPIVGGALFIVAVGFLFFPGADAIAKAPEAPSPAAAAAAPSAARSARPTTVKPMGRPKPGGKMGDTKPDARERLKKAVKAK